MILAALLLHTAALPTAKDVRQAVMVIANGNLCQGKLCGDEAVKVEVRGVRCAHDRRGIGQARCTFTMRMIGDPTTDARRWRPTEAYLSHHPVDRIWYLENDETE